MGDGGASGMYAQGDTEMSLDRQHQSGCATWIAWTLGSAFGGTVGFGLARIGLDILRRFVGRVPPEIVIFGLYLASVGVLQWLVLRQLCRADWWVAACTLVGIAAGLGAAAMGDTVNLVVAYGGVGIVLGLLQWMVLQRGARRAGWWLILSPIGWLTGYAVAQALGRLYGTALARQPEVVGLTLAFGTMSAVVGAITGIVVAWVLRYDKQET
jgi:hypothetical protein